MIISYEAAICKAWWYAAAGATARLPMIAKDLNIFCCFLGEDFARTVHLHVQSHSTHIHLGVWGDALVDSVHKT